MHCFARDARIVIKSLLHDYFSMTDVLNLCLQGPFCVMGIAWQAGLCALQCQRRTGPAESFMSRVLENIRQLQG